MSTSSTILVVDDESFVRDSLVEMLRSSGWETEAAGGMREALAQLEARDIDVVITDLSMPGGDGLQLLQRVRERRPDVPVVLLTGVGTVEKAVQAMKDGAFDFVQKPVDPDQFTVLVGRALEHRRLRAEVRRLRGQVAALRAHGELLGESPWAQQSRTLLDQIAPRDATVLVRGEQGSGRDLVATEIHRRSQRHEQGLVRLSCAAASEAQFEIELFGQRGGPTDRAGCLVDAEGGTLVLDEVGALRPELQAKLLTLLETGEYRVVGESRTRRADVRVVAITSEDLAARAKEGAFRGDLYYRLDVLRVNVAPLRERKEDIADIAADFLRRALAMHGGAAVRLAPEMVTVLRSYDWPGNVRELRNVVERAVILAGDGAIDAGLLRGILESGSRGSAPSPLSDLHLRTRLDGYEKELLLAALQRTAGKKREAAQLLGIDPRNLAYYLRKHSLTEADTP